jgi:hypothetical protein
MDDKKQNCISSQFLSLYNIVEKIHLKPYYTTTERNTLVLFLTYLIIIPNGQTFFL